MKQLKTGILHKFIFILVVLLSLWTTQTHFSFENPGPIKVGEKTQELVSKYHKAEMENTAFDNQVTAYRFYKE